MKAVALSTGRIVNVRLAPRHERQALIAPLRALQSNRPAGMMDQLLAIGRLAPLVAPYVQGCAVEELSAAFTTRPADATAVLRAILIREG